MKYALVLALMLSFSACEVKEPIAEIITDKGNIVFRMYPLEAPETVKNFVKLSKIGFYDGLTFHRVVPGFVVQGGDPKGNGMGGPGYTLKAEISDMRKHEKGSVAMARMGNDVNPDKRSSGSQFYICLTPQPQLDGEYTVFGDVIEGMVVVRQISAGDKILEIKIR